MSTKQVLMSSSKIRHQRALKYVIIWNVNSQRVRVKTPSEQDALLTLDVRSFFDRHLTLIDKTFCIDYHF